MDRRAFREQLRHARLVEAQAQSLRVQTMAGELVACLPFRPAQGVHELKKQLLQFRGADSGAEQVELLDGLRILDDSCSLEQCAVLPGALLVALYVPRILLVSSSFDRTLQLWDAVEGRATMSCALDSAATALCVDRSTMRALVGLARGELRLHSLNDGACLRTFQGHVQNKGVSYLAARWAEGIAISASWDHTAAIWALEGGHRPLRVLHGHSIEVMWAALCPQCHRAASGSPDGTLQVWDVVSGVCTEKLMEPTMTGIYSANVDWQSGRIMAGLENGIVRMWDTDRSAPTVEFLGHERAVWAVEVDWHCGQAATAASDKTIRLWDIVGAQTLRVFVGHDGAVWKVSVDWAAGRLLSASHDMTLRLWDISDGKCMRTLRGHSKSIFCAVLL